MCVSLSFNPTADGAHGRMTDKKLKYDKYPWLAFTQLVEIFSADTPHDRAKEIADLQTVLIQWTYAMEFDPKEVYFRRAEEKSPEFAAIVKKYDEKFKEVIEETKV